MVFARPENLYLLLLLVPLGLGWLFYSRWRRQVILRAGDQSLIQAMIASADQRGANIARVLQLLAITSLIIALAQPQWGMSDEEIEQESLDIVFALDLSRSMLAEDIAPNRLMAAHQELNQVMKNLKGDRVGLVIFTSLSFIQSPLTTDYGAIDFFLRRLHPDQIPVGGTSIGAAMSDSLDALTGRKRQNDDHNFQRAKNQVIVLLTDGEDHESSPIVAAEQARDAGVKVVTVGVGSRDGAPIPQFDRRGTRVGYLRDDDGQTVITRLGEDTLRQMAHLTDGIYIHFERPGQVTTQLVNFLDELERSAFETQITRRYIDRHHYFLIPAFLLLVLSLLLGHRRSWRPLRLRKFLPIALATLLSTTACEQATQRPDPVAKNAAQAIEDEDFEQALSLLDSIADAQDHAPEFHFNRGRALLGLERFEEARQAFARALSSDDADLRADAHYHMGLSFGAEENWRDARQSFQQGLSLFLDSDELDEPELYQLLRENLEIALQNLYPPCASFKDDEEPPHDQPGTALPLEELPLKDQVLCGAERKYFAMPVMANGTLSAKATLRQLRDEPDPEHHFLPRQSGVQLTLFDSTGQTIIAIDKGLEESDEDLARANHIQRLSRRIDDLAMNADHLAGEQEGILFIALEADPGLEFAFDLDAEFIPSCDILDDDYEPNNSAAQTAPINAGSHQLHLCPGDEDWFEITVDKGESLFVDLMAQPDLATKKKPHLLLELRNQDGTKVVAQTYDDGSLLTTGLQDLPGPTTLLVRVLATDETQQGPYALELHQVPACTPPPDEDAAPKARSLSPEDQLLRYQRLCPGHSDYYLTNPDEQGHVKWSLATLPEGVWSPGEYEKQSFPQMNLSLFNLQSSAFIASADPVNPLPGDDDITDDDDEPHDDDDDDDELPLTLSRDQILFVEDAPISDQGILLVSGEPGFYHLQRQDDQDQDDDEQDDDDDQDQDQDDEQQDQDQDQDQDDDQDQDGDEDSQDQDDGEDDDQDQEQDHDEGDQEEQQPDQAPEPDEQEEALSEESLQILRSLEEMDGNFQLQRRFDNVPHRPVERDW